MSVPPSLREALHEERGAYCELCCYIPRVLHTHHINADQSDNHRENLLVLCPSCHHTIHRRDEYPYEKFHRQLPEGARAPVNQHKSYAFDGPRFTAETADRVYGSDDEYLYDYRAYYVEQLLRAVGHCEERLRRATKAGEKDVSLNARYITIMRACLDHKWRLDEKLRGHTGREFELELYTKAGVSVKTIMWRSYH